MATFLLKTEPGTYSFADLQREKRTVWSGVSNPAALIALRTMKKGDTCLIYHTGTEKAVVGLATVVSVGAYQDSAKPGLNDRGEPRFAVVDLAPIAQFARSVTLAEIKADKRCKNFALVTQSRLSVMPVDREVEGVITELSERRR